jgi:hypothetical protein
MMSRRLIAITPLLLIAGIVAQLFLLLAAILVYIPCLIWPNLLNWPYVWMTKGMARIMARAVIGRKKPRTEAVPMG